MANFSHLLFTLFLQYKYWLLFPITVIEGPLIAMATGFLASVHLINPYWALAIIIAGDVTGDVLYYYIGKFSESTRFTRWVVRYFHFEEQKEKVTRSFKSHGGKILLIGKFTHALGAVGLIGAGYADMDMRSFIWYNLIGTTIKSAALVYVGYLAGSAYEKYANYFESGTLWITLGSIGLGLIGLLIQRYFAQRGKTIL